MCFCIKSKEDIFMEIGNVEHQLDSEGPIRVDRDAFQAEDRRADLVVRELHR